MRRQITAALLAGTFLASSVVVASAANAQQRRVETPPVACSQPQAVDNNPNCTTP